MLGHFLQSLFSLHPAHIRDMGFVREVNGIRRRYRRCRTFWDAHLQKCQETIRQGFSRCSKHRKAVILGAGLLHDVPLEDLSKRFRTVILVDVVHPFRSRWHTRRWKNIEHLTADVTETLADVYEAGRDGSIPLPRSQPTLFLDDPEVDFTVSLNLLSQLPCMPMSYLRWQGGRTEEVLVDFARKLIQAHLEYLSKLPGCVTLITDIERHTLNMLRQRVETLDLMFGLKLPKEGAEWIWQLAPCPEVDRKFSYFRRVIGIPDWK